MVKFISNRVDENKFEHKIMDGEVVLDSFKNYNETCSLDTYVKEVGIKANKSILSLLEKEDLFKRYTKVDKRGDVYHCNIAVNGLRGHNFSLELVSKKAIPDKISFYIKSSGFDDTIYMNNWVTSIAKSIKEGYIMIDENSATFDGLQIGLPEEFVDKFFHPDTLRQDIKTFTLKLLAR